MRMPAENADPLWLRTPEYLWGCLGFWLRASARRTLFKSSLWLSALILTSSIAVTLAGLAEGSVIGRSVFGVVASWLLIQGLMRLFVTGMLWVVNLMAEWIAGIDSALARLTFFIERMYQIFFEAFLWIAFFGIQVGAPFQLDS